jgi:hypothetical protein
MASEDVRIVNIEVALDPRDQTRDSVHRAVDSILGHLNCLACGRLAVLAAQTAPDPSPTQKA